MAYSAPTDLLLGNIPLPAYIDTTALVNDAADEIDSCIGYRYITPLDVNEISSPLSRPARLLIIRISRNLASGRLILAVASPEENKNLHAYGWNLVKEATEALYAIKEGDILLDGAPPAANMPTTEPITAPQISNLDAESNVEAFYDRLANPNYCYPSNTRYYSNPDGLVL